MKVALCACLLIVLNLLACGGSQPVADGYRSVALTPQIVQAQMESLRVDYEKAIRYWTAQDNSCNKPSQWFPAADCALTAAQLDAMRVSIEGAVIDTLNAAERARNAWEASANSSTSAQLDTAMRKVRQELDKLGVPKA